jgi:hypothetical protein
MSLTAKLATAILTVSLLAVALIGALNYVYVTRTYLDLARERFGFVLYDLKNTVEKNIGLGFDLADLKQLQGILEREKVRDDQILSIEVFDTAGVTLFSTDRGNIGDAAPDAWLRARAQAGGGGWRVVEREAIVLGTPLVNDFDRAIGSAALSYSLGYYDGRIADIAGKLGWRYAIAILLLVPILAVGVYFALRGTRAAFARMEQILLTLRDPAVTPAQAANDASLQPVFRRMAGRTAEALGDIRRATQDVQRLDDAI